MLKCFALTHKVHPATREMLQRYPLRDLRYYAKGLGITPAKDKTTLITQLLNRKATICGAVGN
mgnify:CR=1 FL=1